MSGTTKHRSLVCFFVDASSCTRVDTITQSAEVMHVYVGHCHDIEQNGIDSSVNSFCLLFPFLSLLYVQSMRFFSTYICRDHALVVLSMRSVPFVMPPDMLVRQRVCRDRGCLFALLLFKVGLIEVLDPYTWYHTSRPPVKPVLMH